MAKLDASTSVNEYIKKEDWRVSENSNAHYSFGALNKYLSSKISALFWLEDVYNEEIANAHNNGFMHIHDLGSISPYCAGYSLTDIIKKGVRGVSNIPVSSPAKHFMSLLNQVANLTTVFQNELAGAVAFSSFDTLCAPFVKVDGLDYDEVYQYMQNFIFSINSNSRGGAEPAFSNLTFDLTPPKDLLTQKAIVGGEEQSFTYKDCQKEMDMINKAFFEIMIKGDSEGAPFAYPIPTYNIHERFDWNNKNNELLWVMTGKFGTPYFANFINSDMDPRESRSMCCRLKIDLRELRRRGGGLFGSGELTGSIGVVTLNLPRLAYLSSKKYDNVESAKKDFFIELEKYMNIAKESLELKRAFLEKQLEAGLFPAFKEYVGHLENHFSTIGLVGMNEMCLNLLGTGIKDDEGKQFSLEVLDFMRDKIADFQEETGNLYNLEATPAESCAFRLAKIDVGEFGEDIITQGNTNGFAPYYTNSCHLPVSEVEDILQVVSHQEELQEKFTGGTVVHLYTQNSMSGDMAKHIIRTICENYKVPYVSISPVYSICPDHNFIEGNQPICPHCGKETEQYQRITGYIRQVSKFNPGKKAEFADRHQLIPKL